MNTSVNWWLVGGIAFAMLVPALFAVPWLWQKIRSQAAQTDHTGKPKRSADDPAPKGAVEYIVDIEGAMLGAPPELVLQCLRNGMSRDVARRVRIEGLLKRGEPTA